MAWKYLGGCDCPDCIRFRKRTTNNVGVEMDEEPIASLDCEGVEIRIWDDGHMEIRNKEDMALLRLTSEQWITVQGFAQFVVERVR